MSARMHLLMILSLVAWGFGLAAEERRERAPRPIAGRAVTASSVNSPPPRLADTGLYADFETRTVAPDVLPFSPQYPLWTDGATKRRWLRLPEGSAIDAADPDAWEFPIGTQLWKEFSLGRRIETRYLERLPDGSWLRVAYLWSADERDATLAPEGGLRGACESAPGVPYDVPARADCAACHQPGLEVLGVSALQLSPARDPLALHAEPPPPGAVDLDALVERGLVRNLPEAFLDTPPRIAARSARERAALGYLHANCGACHRDDGLLAPLELELRARCDEPSATLATTLGRESRFRPPGAGDDDGVRVAAGHPERSALFARMSSRDPRAQMPPIGTHAPDRAALELIDAWIRELEPAGPSD